MPITRSLQEQFPSSFYASFLYSRWVFINGNPLEVISGLKIKPEAKLMAVEELISENMCIQQRIVVRNTSISCAFPLAHTGMTTCLDVPIHVAAVTSV